MRDLFSSNLFSAKKLADSEQRTVLQRVSWPKYEQVLARSRPDRTARFTYWRGQLEMMNSLEEHQRIQQLLETMLLAIGDELDWAIEGYKVPVLKREELQLGVEPDAAYYVQQAERMRRRQAIALEIDPPPDLILEVELSRSALNKFALYAELGIPEVWRYIGKPGKDFLQGNLFIHYLEGDRYREEDYGLAFPFLPTGRILEFLQDSEVRGVPTALRNLREWLYQHT